MRLQQIILATLLIIPVIAAHYFFSLDGSLLTLTSALISAFLLIGFIKLAPSQINAPVVRLVVEIVLTTLLALYFFGQLISYYLQGSYFNPQFFFHMNLSTLTETWPVYYPLFFIFVAWLTAIWMIVWINRNQSRPAKKFGFFLVPIFLLAVFFDPGLRASTVVAAVYLLDPQYQGFNATEKEELGLSSGALKIDNDVENTVAWEKLGLNRKAIEGSTLPVSPGKNLVMIFLEGFDKLYTDEAVFPNLTPNILALNEQGWQLDNLMQVAGTSWTMAGLVSSLCGTPLLHEWGIGGNNIMFTHFLNRAVCLPDILRAAGYQQLFMGGASLGFAGKGIFLSQHSFDHVYGRRELSKRLADPVYQGGWGLYDDSLFDLALEEFNAYAQKKEPFNLTLLTVDTHHPAGLPSHSCPKYSEIDNSILHAAHCTDYLVGRFIEELQSNPAYSNTLVVILSDHLAMRNEAFSLFPKGYKRRLYFNALNSGLEGGSNILATPMDIAPTILSLLGIGTDSKFLAGEDVSSMTDGSRHLKPNDPQRKSAIAFINSNYLTSKFQSEGQSIFLDANEYDFQRGVENIDVSSDGVIFTTTDKHAFFILPKFENSSGNPISMAIDIDAPADTITSVYFTTSWDQTYSSSHDMSRKQPIKKGKNKIVIPLPGEVARGSVKIEPGSIEGQYTINSIEIQM